MADDLLATRAVYLSDTTASRRQILVAALGLLLAAALFVACAPFAARPLMRIPTFIPAYEAVLVFCDLITAVLLYQQYVVVRAFDTLLLATGYIYTGVMATFHALLFPQAVTNGVLFGVGLQSDVWIYLFWHGGFPAFLIAYGFCRPRSRGEAGAIQPAAEPVLGSGLTIILSLLVASCLAAAPIAVAVLWNGDLPALIQNNHFLPTMKTAVSFICLLCAIAIFVLVSKTPFTVLKLWLVVAMSIWILDLVMTNSMNGGRYDFGWYAGKLLGFIAASLLLVFYLIESGRNYSRLAALAESFERLALIDGLTDLSNRRWFDIYLATQIRQMQRQKRGMALLLCDVDEFKKYNDHHGHLAGDACLTQVAGALKSCCRRPTDLAARYGGEEFALILPETGMAGATAIAESVRAAVLDLRITHGHATASPYVTVSVGVAVARGPGATATTSASLIAASDMALYRAKSQGRNRVVNVWLGAEPVT